jgi:hypothetical protein
MLIKAIHFATRRLQPAVFAFLCLALAQLGLALIDYQAQPSPAVARVHIVKN